DLRVAEESNMASDRARVSFDKSRQYRAVVIQQGRVTLEADVNEAQLIAQEAQREELLDLIGPAGTPDNGYAVSAGVESDFPFEFQVGPGTMYGGGLRVSLPSAIHYSTQPGWLDHVGDPLWVDPAGPGKQSQQNELVYLLLQEQEVSAVEDLPLRDVALGG